MRDGLVTRGFMALTERLDRRYGWDRLPKPLAMLTLTGLRMTLRRKIKVRAKGDTRLYVRVQQEDGHRMWSSPIYVFR